MLDSKPSFPESAGVTALKAAVLAEQHVLELDMRIVSARVQWLLGESLRHEKPADTPIVTISKSHRLGVPLAPLHDATKPRCAC